jgi:signal transduction histidine kinase
VRPGPAIVLVSATALAVAALLDLRVPGSHQEAVEIEPGSIGGIPALALAWGAAVILAHDPRHRLGWLLGLFGVWWSLDSLAASWLTYATLSDPALPGATPAFWVYQRLGAWLLLALPLLLLLYPDGRLPAGRARIAAVSALVATSLLPLTLVAIPAEIAEAGSGAGELPEPLRGLDLDLVTVPLPDGFWEVAIRGAFLVLAVSMVPVLVLVVRRYRSASGLARMRLRWLLWAAIVDVLLVATIRLLPYGLESAVLTVAVVVTVVAVVVGITRPELLDVDRLLGGTLLYAGLLTVTLVVDVAVIGATRWLLGGRLDTDQALLLAVFVVAAVYAPLRHRLWRLVRARVVGERDDPYAVVSGLAQRLEESPVAGAQLLEVVQVVATAFRARYVGVELWQSTGEVVMAEHGERPDDVHAMPIAYRGEQIGRLLLSRHGVANRLRRADERLLADVVRQAAAAARADQLARDLQQSRERLVTAVEDERRRLRRELHDGLGPTLAAVASRIDTARLTAARNPGESQRMLGLAREEVTGMLAEVRRLVHGLRPPALDDVGLVRALRQTAERIAPAGLAVEVVAPDDLDGLAAAVEVAAFRIASEALTNVVRHAGASRCEVRLERDRDALVVRVADDGAGIGPDVRAGVGLVSLRERAEELGGRVEVRAGAHGGTEVEARLPLPAPTLPAPVLSGAGAEGERR